MTNYTIMAINDFGWAIMALITILRILCQFTTIRDRVILWHPFWKGIF